MSVPWILVVEDQSDLRAMLVDWLAFLGYTPADATNGAEALALMQQSLPALVLLDLYMPVMDGWEFRKRQLADPQLALVPVICLTAAHDVADAAVHRLHAPCFRKPFDFDALLAAIIRVCGEPPMQS